MNGYKKFLIFILVFFIFFIFFLLGTQLGLKFIFIILGYYLLGFKVHTVLGKWNNFILKDLSFHTSDIDIRIKSIHIEIESDYFMHFYINKVICNNTLILIHTNNYKLLYSTNSRDIFLKNYFLKYFLNINNLVFNQIIFCANFVTFSLSNLQTGYYLLNNTLFIKPTYFKDLNIKFIKLDTHSYRNSNSLLQKKWNLLSYKKFCKKLLSDVLSYFLVFNLDFKSSIIGNEINIYFKDNNYSILNIILKGKMYKSWLYIDNFMIRISMNHKFNIYGRCFLNNSYFLDLVIYDQFRFKNCKYEHTTIIAKGSLKEKISIFIFLKGFINFQCNVCINLIRNKNILLDVTFNKNNLIIFRDNKFIYDPKNNFHITFYGNLSHYFFYIRSQMFLSDMSKIYFYMQGQGRFFCFFLNKLHIVSINSVVLKKLVYIINYMKSNAIDSCFVYNCNEFVYKFIFLNNKFILNLIDNIELFFRSYSSLQKKQVIFSAILSNFIQNNINYSWNISNITIFTRENSFYITGIINKQFKLTMLINNSYVIDLFSMLSKNIKNVINMYFSRFMFSIIVNILEKNYSINHILHISDINTFLKFYLFQHNKNYFPIILKDIFVSYFKISFVNIKIIAYHHNKYKIVLIGKICFFCFEFIFNKTVTFG